MSAPRKKILCIEDDVETAVSLAEEFEERGNQVSLAHDGQRGFTAILKDEPVKAASGGIIEP